MDWIALLAALPTLITSLGDHLPGLLVAGAMGYVYVQREREHEAERTAWLAKSVECNRESDELVRKCLTAMQSVADRLTAYEKAMELDSLIRELAERKSRAEDADAGKPGQD
jgi:hypothetical protein